MKELIGKKVKIVLNPAPGNYSGMIGTTCTVTGFENGFVVVSDFRDQTSYYALDCIKSISLLDEEQFCEEKRFEEGHCDEEFRDDESSELWLLDTKKAQL